MLCFGLRGCYFFFSSRRRHTIFDCDWSSDVCSSDLDQLALWWKDGRNPDQVLGRNSGIAQRQLERRQALFVFTDPLGEEDPLGDHVRSEEHTSELQSQSNLVCRLLLEKKKKKNI